VKEPEGIAFKINLSHEFFETFISLVGHVNVVRLEVKQIEWRRRQSVKWVLRFLLLFLGWFRFGSLGLLFGLLSYLRLLLLGELRRLDWFLAEFNVSESSDERWQTCHTHEPSRQSRMTLLEALLQASLERAGEEASKVDISNSAMIANKPRSISFGKAVVDPFKLFF